jgi:C2 domain
MFIFILFNFNFMFLFLYIFYSLFNVILLFASSLTLSLCYPVLPMPSTHYLALLPPSLSISPSPSPSPSLSLPPSPSLSLSLTRISARNLAKRDIIGSSDPYVTLLVENVKEQTDVKRNNLNPKWNKSFSLYVIERLRVKWKREREGERSACGILLARVTRTSRERERENRR